MHTEGETPLLCAVITYRQNLDLLIQERGKGDIAKQRGNDLL